MKNKLLILSAFFLFCLSTRSLGTELTAIRFEIINNTVILKVKTVNNLDLNIVFDSASNEFLLDSTLARGLHIINDSSETHGTNFINGTVSSMFFVNRGIFKDALLNSLYKRGNSINLNEWSKKCHVHIDGLIGVNDSFKQIVLGLDFNKKLLTLNEAVDFTGNEHYKKLKMIYTDGGHEIVPNSAFHQLSACKIKLTLSEKCIIETNVQFDTGFNKSFIMLTNLNIDSIMHRLNKPFNVKSDHKSALGSGKSKLYDFEADSISIDDRIKLIKTRVHMGMASKIALAGSGSLNTLCLAGIEFLRKYRKIYFDYKNMDIYLYENA